MINTASALVTIKMKEVPCISPKSRFGDAGINQRAHAVVDKHDLHQHRSVNQRADRNRQRRHLRQNSIANHIAI